MWCKTSSKLNGCQRDNSRQAVHRHARVLRNLVLILAHRGIKKGGDPSNHIFSPFLSAGKRCVFKAQERRAPKSLKILSQRSFRVWMIRTVTFHSFWFTKSGVPQMMAFIASIFIYFYLPNHWYQTHPATSTISLLLIARHLFFRRRLPNLYFVAKALLDLNFERLPEH